MKQFFDAILASEVTILQAAVLSHIEDNPQCRESDVMEHLFASRNQAHLMLLHLGGRGLVVKSITYNESARRKTPAYKLTRAGHAILKIWKDAISNVQKA